MQPQGLYTSKLPTVISYSKNTYGFQQFGWSAMYDYSGKNLKFSLTKLALNSHQNNHHGSIFRKPLSLVHLVADFLSCLFSYLKQMYPEIHSRNTVWCVAVPINWKKETLLLLSEAATLAGMISSPTSPYLKFCLESEAGALSCIQENIQDMHPGTTFLVVDAGVLKKGGSINTYQCKVGPKASLEEIWMKEGSQVSACTLDAQFYTFLRENIGEKAFTEVFTNHPTMEATRRDIEVRWERMKREFSGSPERWMQLLPFSNVLYELIDSHSKYQLKQRQGTDAVLFIRQEDMQQLFQPIVNQLIQLIENQLSTFPTLDYVILVGGLASNRYLHQCLRQYPKICSKLKPQVTPPDTAILKGAIHYVISKSWFYPRIAKSTIAMLVHVKKNQFPKLRDPFVCIANQTFYILLRQGDTIHTPIIHANLSFLHSSATGVIKLYELREHQRPSSVQCIGKLAVCEPFLIHQEKEKRRRVTLLLHFSDMEMKCKVINQTNRREWETTLPYDVTQTRIFDSEGERIQPLHL
ncbi:Heat shock 70 kDa protein 12A [Coelomomyces lativittatus]|nr:Heat shock 70 kDa protein 12A [Coelomomyces lativittatus]